MGSNAKETITACLHQFTNPSNGLKAGTPFEVITVSYRSAIKLSLCEIRFAPLGTYAVPALSSQSILPIQDPTTWSEALISGANISDDLEPKTLTSYIATPVLRKVLTGHIVALHYAKILKQRQLNGLLAPESSDTSFAKQGESITRATARIYEELMEWGESKAAAIIAEAEGVTPSTIHNRLQLARAGKYLATPGKGVRKKN